MFRFLNFFFVLLVCAGFAAAAPVPHRDSARRNMRHHTGSQPPAMQGSRVAGRAAVDVKRQQPRVFVEDVAVIRRTPEVPVAAVLVKRVGGDDPYGKGAEVAEAIESIVETIKNNVAEDQDDRGKFTINFIDEALKTKPDANWMIVCTDHEAHWKGEKGKDWDQSYAEHNGHEKTGYTVYWGHEGEFTLKGDGGFLNWAYAGRFTKDPDNDHHIFFQA